jgi:hypothetical protein
MPVLGTFASATVSVLGNMAYVAGTVQLQHTVVCFDVAMGAWSGHYPTLNDTRHSGVGSLHSAGGHACTSSVKRYDMTRNIWKTAT